MNSVRINDDRICAIDVALDEATLQVQKRRARWYSCRSVMKPLVDSLLELDIEPTFNHEFDIQFTGDKRKLDAVLSLVRFAGFTLDDPKPPGPKDTSWSCYATHPGLTVRIWVYFTSSVCKRVKIGTKMVEQDIYEIGCDPFTVDALPAIAIEDDKI